MRYLRPPLKVTDGIPVFTDTDSYIKNYEKISLDHFGSLDHNNKSPFMSKEQI